MKKAVLSFSGGMDSTSLLLHLLANKYEVKTITFDYGQKHSLEIEKGKELLNFIPDTLLHPANSHFLKFPLQDLIVDSALMKGGDEVPEGHYEAENMKATVVPNRNKIFSSMIQAAALSWATSTKSPVVIAMGIHAGDHAIYPDCRQEFRDADFKAFQEGNWESNLVSLNTPYLYVDKFDILQDGLNSCKILGLDFDEVYKRTNTSYKPVSFEGKEYSDYKSASSVERIEAFIKLGRPDPVQYADETGLVTWETAKSHVETVLQDGSK